MLTPWCQGTKGNEINDWNTNSYISKDCQCPPILVALFLFLVVVNPTNSAITNGHQYWQWHCVTCAPRHLQTGITHSLLLLRCKISCHYVSLCTPPLFLCHIRQDAKPPYEMLARHITVNLTGSLSRSILVWGSALISNTTGVKIEEDQLDFEERLQK